jgi:hypothetical protein
MAPAAAGAADSPPEPTSAAAPPSAAPPFESIDLELELPPPPVRRRPGSNRTMLVLWILFAVVLLGTVWFLVASLRSDRAPNAEPLDGAAGVAVEGSLPTRSGELLPYSIQVTAFQTMQAARAELSTRSPSPENTPFFISPEEIQGVLYYRILAGMATDTTAAKLLRDRLLATDQIDADDAAGTWSLLQFTPLAFDLGEYPDEKAARERSDSLLVLQIPSYVAVVPYSDGSRRWQVYGGAFRDNASAGGMRAMLEPTGVPVRLMARTGIPAALPE